MRRAATPRCSAGCWCISPTAARSTGPISTAHTTGFDAALARAREIAPDARARTAAATGLDEGDVARFFDLFRATPTTVTCFSQGVNQSAQGTDKVNAIINCHLATGRIGRPGMGPFSLTGQPNAMGGREVGGLANQLAAHMGFAPDEVDRVRRFWNAPHMAEREGLKAVQMFEAIERGEIKALWVMATNPAVSLPRAGADARGAEEARPVGRVRERARATTRSRPSPHVLLPAAAWGEKDGTVTNSERRISRQRAFLPPPGEARPDWWIVCEVARGIWAIGEAFAYRGAADVFREHAALSAFENDGARHVRSRRRSRRSRTRTTTRSSRCNGRCAPGARPTRARLFADGGFRTPDRKARFIAPEPPALREPVSAEYPLRLNTGRLRDQWHSMTRTGPEPEARRAQAGAVPGNPSARCQGAWAGARRLRACPHRARRLHAQGRGLAPASSAARSSRRSTGATPTRPRRASAIWSSPQTDPFSGQPEAKATPVAVAPVAFAYRGFALAREPLRLPDATWWARVALDGATGWLFATNDAPMAWHDLAPNLFPDAVLTEYVDRQRGLYRAAAFVDGRLEGALFVGPADAAAAMERPARRWSATPASPQAGPSSAPASASALPPSTRRWPRGKPRRRRRDRHVRCAPAPNAAPACRN